MISPYTSTPAPHLYGQLIILSFSSPRIGMSAYRSISPSRPGTPLFITITTPPWRLGRVHGSSISTRKHLGATLLRARQLAVRPNFKCSFDAITHETALSSKQTSQLHQLVDLLLVENQKVNLTAIRTREDVIVKHIQDALTLLSTIDSEQAQSIVDVGAGAGFPGFVLAIARPDLQVTLLESVRKKTAFQDLAVAELGLSNVESVWARAEDAGHGSLRESQCLAVARSVAEMRVLAELALPLVRIGGALIAQKALDDRQEEIEQAHGAVRQLGGVIEDVRPAWPEHWGDCGTLRGSDGTVRVKSLVVVRKEKKTRKDFPRKPGTPSKLPLR